MEKQERRFTLAEVHTKIGTMGEVQFDGALMDVLGVRPGDFIVFLVDKEGLVQVKAAKREAGATEPLPAPLGQAITQPSLFPDVLQPPIENRRGRES